MKIKNFSNSFLSPIAVLPLFFAVILFGLMLNFSQYTQLAENKELIANLPFALSVIFGVLYLFFSHKIGRLEQKKIIAVLFIVGFAMRLMYCIKYDYSQNQHDVETLLSSGHLSYIYNLAIGKGLPDTNTWQFCHPPLSHFLSSLVVKFSLSLGFDTSVAFENVQFLSCFYSSLLMFVGYLLLKECNIKGRPLTFACALLSFNPIFYILAGSINNDTLTILLITFAVLFLIKWYKRPTVFFAFACAVFTGLGMMTKFSAVLMLFVCAVVVLIKVIFNKSYKFLYFIKHTGVFLAVALPLGLWYQVRNAMLFGQPIGYVAPISTTSKLFVGDISFAERFIFPSSLIPKNVYVDVWNEHNLWQYLIRNSLFGEYSFGSETFAVIAVLANVVLCIATIVAIVLLLLNRGSVSCGVLPVAVTFVIQWIAFICFNIASPYRCSMDFRYIVPVLICSVCFIGVLLSLCNKKGGFLANLLSSIVESTIVIFSISSILIFI